MLTFKEELHEYRWDDSRVPNVTTIIKPLRNMGYIEPETLRRNREFGKAVHLMTELYDREELDEVTLDDVLKPYLEGYKLFLEREGFVIESIEEMVYSKKYRYAGKLDRIGLLQKGKGKLKKWVWAVVDYKTGAIATPDIGVQLAAYQNAALEQTTRVWAEPPRHRASVRILPYDYRLDWWEDKADWQTFLACLQLKNWRIKNGITEQNEVGKCD